MFTNDIKKLQAELRTCVFENLFEKLDTKGDLHLEVVKACTQQSKDLSDFVIGKTNEGLSSGSSLGKMFGENAYQSFGLLKFKSENKDIDLTATPNELPISYFGLVNLEARNAKLISNRAALAKARNVLYGETKPHNRSYTEYLSDPLYDELYFSDRKLFI